MPLPSSPPPSQPARLRVLCLWSAVISVTQLAFVIFFFTTERPRTPPLSELKAPHAPFPSKMLTIPGDQVTAGGIISWQRVPEESEDSKLIEVSDGGVLTILEDGYYFFSLRVKLESCEQHRVILNHTSKVLLQADAPPPACTASLGKVAWLSASREAALQVTVSPPSVRIVREDTHLDVIFMPMAP